MTKHLKKINTEKQYIWKEDLVANNGRKMMDLLKSKVVWNIWIDTEEKKRMSKNKDKLKEALAKLKYEKLHLDIYGEFRKKSVQKKDSMPSTIIIQVNLRKIKNQNIDKSKSKQNLLHF